MIHNPDEFEALLAASQKFQETIRSMMGENAKSQKPILLDDTHRQRVEKALGKNFSDADTLVTSVENAGYLRIDEIDIHLSPKLIERLKSRAIGVPFEKYLTQVVIRLLEEEAGLR